MAEKSNKTMLLLAQSVKTACIQAAIDGYQNAAISGLCHEGASEASVSAIRMIDLESLVQACLVSNRDQTQDGE